MDLLPVSIGLGLAVSLLFSELFGLAAGGMVVPGYIALSLSKPLDVALTLAAGVATYLLVHVLSMSTVIYGKRRTVIMILVGYVIGMLVGTLSLPPLEPTPQRLAMAPPTEFSVIGYIIPGLIAIWIDRQGWIETISVLLTASVVVRLLLILVFGTELHV
jgi:poly-gamma-glutamate biosynthesis protein PgsC/CapC